MEFVTTKAQMLANIRLLQSYLERPGVDHDFAADRIRKGICFVVTGDATPFFAPSRFIGYKGNSRHAHVHNIDKDGRDTNGALADVLGSGPTPSDDLEQQYEKFLVTLGIELGKAPFNVTRKFWDLR